MKKSRKPKLTIKPQALTWLAVRCSDKEFNRAIVFYDRGLIESLLEYVRAITDEETYRQFEESNLPPEALAERRQVEAERIQAEEDARRTIREGDQPPITHREILSDGRWRSFGPSLKEVAEAEHKDAVGLEEIPDAKF